MAVYIKDVERADANYAVGVWDKEWGGKDAIDGQIEERGQFKKCFCFWINPFNSNKSLLLPQLKKLTTQEL